jgi:hypothetical protein
MDGFFQVITLLLGLSGFGIAPNPKPTPPEALLTYGWVNPDLVAYVDVASLVPNNYKLLSKLADQPQFQADPELAKIVRKAIDEIEGARGLAKTMTGIDVTTDINDVTAFVGLVPHHQPNALVAVHGKFAPSVVDAIARLTGKSSTPLAGGAVVDIDDSNALALTKDGVMLFGTNSLVRERVSGGWHAPSRAASTTLGRVADVLAQKPVFTVAVALSQAARDDATKDLDRGVMIDLLRRHQLASFAVFHDGAGWTWIDSTKEGLDQISQFSDGLIQLLRASQIGPRGVAKMLLAALESYRGDGRVDALLQRKADLLKIVDAYLGDGSFRAKVDNDAKAMRLTVRLTGHSASDVLPLGMIVPGAAFGMMYFARSESTATIAAPKSIAAPVAAPPPPSGGGSWPRSH